jgi:hypothetical protein
MISVLALQKLEPNDDTSTGLAEQFDSTYSKCCTGSQYSNYNCCNG